MISSLYQQEIILRIAQNTVETIDLAQFISYASRYLCQRVVIIIAAGARVTCYDSRGGDYVHSVMRSIFIYVNDGAYLEYIDQQDWAETVCEFTITTICADTNSTICYQGLYMGARYAKTIINLDLYGQRANAQIRVGSVVKGKSYHSVVSKQYHVAPHTVSSCTVRSIVYDQAHTEYYGTIHIDEAAQYCEVYQKHKSLLLSDAACSYARPSLEVHAHEVQCGHGSAIGQLDDDHLFYLQCRGITKKVAQRLLVCSFFDELYTHDTLQTSVRESIL